MKNILKGVQKAEGIIYFDGEATPIYQIFCPICGCDRLELSLNNYICEACGTIFNTIEEETSE